jgi:hypothetical protein
MNCTWGSVCPWFGSKFNGTLRRFVLRLAVEDDGSKADLLAGNAVARGAAFWEVTEAVCLLLSRESA